MRLAGPMPAQLIRMRAGPCCLARLGSAAAALVGVGDVAGDGDAADLGRELLARAVEIEVEQRDLGAGRGQRRAVAAPRPEAPPVTMAACPFDVHVICPLRRSMIARGGGGSA